MTNTVYTKALKISLVRNCCFDMKQSPSTWNYKPILGILKDANSSTYIRLSQHGGSNGIVKPNQLFC